MNKSQLIAQVSATTGYTQKAVGEVLDALLATIVGTVASGDKILLVGFGTFSRRLAAARDARNPRTGEAIRISERRRPKFSPGKDFEEAVR